MKVLVLPDKVPKKKINGIDYELLHVLHRNQTTVPKDHPGKTSGISGLLNNLSDKTNIHMKTPIMDSEVSHKISSAAKELGDVLNNFGA